MAVPTDRPHGLPTSQQLRLAVRLYVQHAYGGDVSPAAAGCLPPQPDCEDQDFQPSAWLMGDAVERTPADAPLEAVRSFALRLGNAVYPHMKLRLSHPPNDAIYLFSVDSHDEFLCAPPGSSEHQQVEELKRHNAALAATIMTALDHAGLPTERAYLRQKIEQSRRARP